MAYSEIYSKELIRRFRNPKNYGEIKNADGVGKVGNPTCGDVLFIYIKVKNDKIEKIKFKTFGCLPPDEKVLVNEGDWMDVSLINKGYNILDCNGNGTRVLDTYMRDYKGDMLTIIPFVSKFNSLSIVATDSLTPSKSFIIIYLVF